MTGRWAVMGSCRTLRSRFQSVEDGKNEVEQHEIGLFTTNRFQSLRTIVSNGDFETLAVQQGTEELDDAIHVFDHQDLCHWGPERVLGSRHREDLERKKQPECRTAP